MLVTRMTALWARRDKGYERPANVSPGCVDKQPLDQRTHTRDTVSTALVIAVVPVSSVVASVRKESEDSKDHKREHKEFRHHMPRIKINIYGQALIKINI